MTNSSKQPDLSIVIVSWNTAELLRECLQSVYDNFGEIPAEVFVVDNASTDGSAEMVRACFPQAQLICNHVNRGFAAANNQAMTRARGRHIVLLNSDTITIGDVLHRAVDYMNTHDDVGVLGCQVLNTDRSIQNTCFRDPNLRGLAMVATGLHHVPWKRFSQHHEYGGWDRRSERDVNVVTGCFMCVRQLAINDVGLFDEQFFFYAEEADWCRRFRDAGWAVRFAPVGQIIHHGGASAMKLDERRTVLLGEALVRLLLKRRGRAAASVAWLVLFLFNVSRSVIWGFAYCLTFNQVARRKAALFAKAALQFFNAWPACRTSGENLQFGDMDAEVPARGRRYFRARAQGSIHASSMADAEQKMTHNTHRRVLAVASGGGHWVQLLRLRPALAGNDVTYVTVSTSARDEIGDEPLFVVPDATRWTKFRLVSLMLRMLVIMIRTRPNVVISTGAAPGYFAVLFGKLFGAQTIWVDSIANVEHLSLSGRKARRFADTTLTQWPDLADESTGVVYAGAVV